MPRAKRPQFPTPMLPNLHHFVPGEAGQDAEALRTWPVPSPAISYGIGEEVHAHADCRFPRLRWVVVNLRIFPPITEVRLVRVVHGEAAIEEYPESLRRLVVMRVDLRYTLRKIVDQVIDRMIERNLDERVIRVE